VLTLCACGASEEEPAADAPATAGDEASARETETATGLCASIEAEGPWERSVDGAHRACAEDADCAGVLLDCSNLRCTAVHRDHAEAYAEPLSCEGYDGPVGNYDCRPRFGAEQAACVEGCCVTERLEARASPREACAAIGAIFTSHGCEAEPAFSVEGCVAEVESLRGDADAAARRRAQVGLDCARVAMTCPQVRFCLAQLRGG